MKGARHPPPSCARQRQCRTKAGPASTTIEPAADAGQVTNAASGGRRSRGTTSRAQCAAKFGDEAWPGGDRRHSARRRVCSEVYRRIVVDTLLNGAVAMRGGPGRYSYSPSPVRRAWRVDDMLLKVDQDEYNRFQDGVEMLAYSFAEATNPRNRINVGIPAPTWRNRDGTPLSREEAARWLRACN